MIELDFKELTPFFGEISGNLSINYSSIGRLNVVFLEID